MYWEVGHQILPWQELSDESGINEMILMIMLMPSMPSWLVKSSRVELSMGGRGADFLDKSRVSPGCGKERVSQ